PRPWGRPMQAMTNPATTSTIPSTHAVADQPVAVPALCTPLAAAWVNDIEAPCICPRSRGDDPDLAGDSPYALDHCHVIERRIALKLVIDRSRERDPPSRDFHADPFRRNVRIP